MRLPESTSVEHGKLKCQITRAILLPQPCLAVADKTRPRVLAMRTQSALTPHSSCCTRTLPLSCFCISNHPFNAPFRIIYIYILCFFITIILRFNKHFSGLKYQKKLNQCTPYIDLQISPPLFLLLLLLNNHVNVLLCLARALLRQLKPDFQNGNIRLYLIIDCP